MLEPKDRREWFVSDGNGLEGPFTAERIRDLVRWRRISPRAYLCDEYHSAWIPIRQSALASALVEELGPDASEAQRGGRDGSPTELAGAVPKVALVAAALALAAVVGMLAD